MRISTEQQKVDREKFSDGYDLAFGKKKSESIINELEEDANGKDRNEQAPEAKSDSEGT